MGAFFFFEVGWSLGLGRGFRSQDFFLSLTRNGKQMLGSSVPVGRNLGTSSFVDFLLKWDCQN